MTVGIISTGSFAKRLWPGVNTWFGMEYESRVGMYEKLFDIESSDKRYEEDVIITPMGLPSVKNEGAGTTYQGFKQSWVKKYDMINYSTGFVITKEMQADDQYAAKIAEMGSKKIADRFLVVKETLGANVLNNGFSSSYVGGDNVALFSASHALGAGGNLSNIAAVSMDLNEGTLEQACIDIRGYVDDAGVLVMIKPKLLVIHKNDEFNAHRILNSNLRSATANNDSNALKELGSISDGCMADDYLTDAAAWFIKTDCPNGLKHIKRSAYESNAETDFDTDNAKFKFSERFAFGFSDPRGAYGNQGSS